MRIAGRRIGEYPLLIRCLFWLQRRKYGQVLYQKMSTRFNSALDIPSQGFCDRKRRELLAAFRLCRKPGYISFWLVSGSNCRHAVRIIDGVILGNRFMRTHLRLSSDGWHVPCDTK